jgi:hypothetical protein
MKTAGIADRKGACVVEHNAPTEYADRFTARGKRTA